MVSGRTILSSPAEILRKGMILSKHVKTAEIFEKVAKIISENADIALEEIKMESDLERIGMQINRQQREEFIKT